MEPQVMLVIAIILPFFAAAGVNLFNKFPNFREAWQIAAAIALIYLIHSVYDFYTQEIIAEAELFKILPGISLSFNIEPLGLIYSGLVAVLWFFAIIYSAGYLRLKKDSNQTRFFIFFSLSIGASIGLAFAANLITAFIFYELLTLVTYPLVIHDNHHHAKTVGRTYLAYLLGSSLAFLLPAIALTYFYAGSIDFTDGGILYKTEIANSAKIIIFFLFLFGAAKSAIMPMHNWLPKAMVAPAPVSALLHAVAVVNAGVFLIGKVMIYVFGADNIEFSDLFKTAILGIAAVTIIIASILAARERNIKCILAYSTISNLSYIILSFAILSQAGVAAAGAQIITHAIGKIGLFFIAGAILLLANANNIRDVEGLGYRQRILFVCFFLCSISIIGVPYMAGGYSKDLIILASKESELGWIIYIIYTAMAISAYYLLRISYNAFFRPAFNIAHIADSANSMAMKLVIIAITALLLAFPLYSHNITTLLERVII